MRWYGLLLLLALPLWAEDAEVIEDDGIQVFLTNERGDPQTTFYFNPGQKSADEVVFRHRVTSSKVEYSSWALEITEPKEGLMYRMVFSGNLPFLIHWDGMFDNDRGIVPNERYFLKLLLIGRDKRVHASPYAFFSTAERELEVGTQVELVQIEAAKLFVQLSGAIKAISTQTPTYNSNLFPNIDGDLGIYWREDHRFGIHFDVTSNILTGWNFYDDGNVLRYSDFSFGYRYRLAGTPPRRPVLPYVPPYLKDAVQPQVYDAKYYGAPLNLEIGARFYNTTAAGAEKQVINNELPGQMKGLQLTVNVDSTVGRFRAYGALHAGTTLLGGKVNRLGVEAAIVYDRWQSIAPGLFTSMTIFNGIADENLIPSVGEVSFTIYSIGGYLIFKV